MLDDTRFLLMQHSAECVQDGGRNGNGWCAQADAESQADDGGAEDDAEEGDLPDGADDRCDRGEDAGDDGTDVAEPLAGGISIGDVTFLAMGVFRDSVLRPFCAACRHVEGCARRGLWASCRRRRRVDQGLSRPGR